MALKTTVTTGTLDGLSFGTGVDASGFSLVVNKWQGWDDSPPAVPTIQNKLNADGAFQGPDWRGAKSLSLVCTGFSESVVNRELLLSKIAGICVGAKKIFPLTRVERTRTLTIWVKLDGAITQDPRPDGHHVFFTVPLVAADPYKYTADNPIATTGLASLPSDGIQWGGPAGVTGIEWGGPAAVTGLVYQTDSGVSGVLRLTNSGTVEAPIKMQFSPTVTNPQVVNIQTGQIIRWAGAVSGIDPLKINTKTGATTLGGINVAAGLSDNDFFGVPPSAGGIPGFVDIVYTATSGSGTLFTASNANVFN